MKIETVVQRPADGVRIEQRVELKHCVDFTRINARRVTHCERGDEAQIEISLQTCPSGSTRWRTQSTSFILTPAEARALALAICPELEPR